MLGAAIAALVVFFVKRFTVFNAQVLGAVVSIVAGGVVTAFLGVGKATAWVGYCIGLGSVLVPLLLFPVIAMGSRTESDSKDPRLKMLDELEDRKHRLSTQEFDSTKSAILADIRNKPLFSEKTNDENTNAKRL